MIWTSSIPSQTTESTCSLSGSVSNIRATFSLPFAWPWPTAQWSACSYCTATSPVSAFSEQGLGFSAWAGRRLIPLTAPGSGRVQGGSWMMVGLDPADTEPFRANIVGFCVGASLFQGYLQPGMAWEAFFPQLPPSPSPSEEGSAFFGC